MKHSTTIPLRVVSIANLREHWRVKAKRAAAHKLEAWAIPRLVDGQPTFALPAIVTLVRIAPKPLDDDNLRTAFKSVRDGIADRFGVPDNDKRLTWCYGQARGLPRQYACTITIESGETDVATSAAGGAHRLVSDPGRPAAG